MPGMIPDVPKDMLRVDGTVKSKRGYLGPIQNKKTGGTMTEVSVQFEDFMDNKPIPVIVPTLTDKEVKQLQNINIGKEPIPKPILQKAIKHAIQRRSEGKNPFYQDGE